MQVDLFFFVGLQRFNHHQWPQVRTANANIDNIGNGFAGITFPVTRDDLFREVLHLGQHLIDFGHDIFAVNQNGRIAAVAQSHMKHGTIFGGIDFLARKFAGDGFFQATFLGQLQ